MKSFASSASEQVVFRHVEQELNRRNIKIGDVDSERPWGGFFVIEPDSLSTFVSEFFPGIELRETRGELMLSPKILIVAPGKRLSWQYHYRRSEIWRVVSGSAGVMISDTDKQTPVKTCPAGETIRIQQGQRHRLVGLDVWGVIAEIWQHSDPAHPSDEEDIVRLEDDFGR